MLVAVWWCWKSVKDGRKGIGQCRLAVDNINNQECTQLKKLNTYFEDKLNFKISVMQNIQVLLYACPQAVF